jgi:transaldolase
METKLTTKVFLDSGNPAETKEAKDLLGFLDGQTTNPSLVAKNPHIQELKSTGSLDEGLIWGE